MDELIIQNILIALIRSELTETDIQESEKTAITTEQLPVLYNLSKKHDLVHIVSTALGKAGLLGADEISKKFRKQEAMSVYRCEQIKYELTKISDVFQNSQIPFILLKGSVLRPYYPYDSMRTSCDIDILVHKEDIDKSVQSLVQIGYKCDERHYHDISLFSSSGVHLELHFSILQNMKKIDRILEKAWDYAVPVDGFRYEFTDAFFQFHIFAHAFCHFISGGCGIKSLMDLWIIENKMDISIENTKDLLNKAEIYKFAVEMNELADICFFDGEHTEFTRKLLSYILYGGVYGSLENMVSISKAKTNSTFVYALKRLFLPYRTMRIIYPFLQYLPFLLPFCWIARLLQKIFAGKTNLALSEIRISGDITEDKMTDLRDIREHLGI